MTGIITAQADAANEGVDSDGAATNALNRILASLRAGSSSRFGRFGNIRTRSEAQESSSPSEEDLPADTYERQKWVKSWWKKPHTEPQPAGVELLMSGEFGRVGRKAYTQPDGSRNFSRVLRERSMNIHPLPKQELCEVWLPLSLI